MAVPQFLFSSEAVTEVSFTVTGFDASEALSRLYRYEIELRAPTAEVAAREAGFAAILEHPARFVMRYEGIDYPVHGILAEFEELQVTPGQSHFRAVLVPRLWRLDLYRTNEIFVRRDGLDNNAVSIVREVLSNAGFSEGTDFLLPSDTASLLDREYVCQFRESDFNFVARLLEQEGLYFHFEQDRQAGVERLVVTDSVVYADLGLSDLNFDAGAGGDAAYRSISAFSCRTRRIADAVSVRDYDPGQPSLDVAGIYPAAALPASAGVEYLYGERSIDSSEAQRIARLRFEQKDAEKVRYYGESGVCALRPALALSFGGHPKASYASQRFLLVEVQHRGRGLDAAGAAPGRREAQYRNSFVAMPADKPYRPPLQTPKPRFHGTMTAFVYAETGTQRAELDAYGRYRVVLPFDRTQGPAADSSDPGRKASYWMRMMQTYVGEDAGSFYPLKGGAEVLLSFINGDPDYPVIVGAVPNARTPSLLTADTAHIATISTTDLLSIRADGGSHIDLSVDQSEEKSRGSRLAQADDFSFPTFNGVGDTNAREPRMDGSAFDTMTPAEEKDGSILVEREYGNRHQYQDGDTYSWGHRNANVYNFGPAYEETHMDVHPEDLSTLVCMQTDAPDMTDSATFSRSDRAAGRHEFTFPYPTDANGDGPEDSYEIWGVASMEKVWGDSFTYQHGQTYEWAHNSNATYSYGNGYTENLVNTDRGEFSNIETEAETYTGKIGDFQIGLLTNFLARKPLKDSRHDAYRKKRTDALPVISAVIVDPNRYDYPGKYDPKTTLVEKTWGNSFSYQNGKSLEVKEGESHSQQFGDVDEWTVGNVYSRFDGYHEESFRGMAMRWFWGDSNDFFVGAQSELKLAGSIDVHVGLASETFIGLKLETALSASLKLALAGEWEVKTVGGKVRVLSTDADVNTLKAQVNDIETKVNKLGGVTNDVRTCANKINSLINEIDASTISIQTNGLTVIS